MILKSRKPTRAASDSCLICLAWIYSKLICVPSLSLELKPVRQFTSFKAMCKLLSAKNGGCPKCASVHENKN